ncbi:hypothetical protein DDZ18_11100 [Marinicauda salina]|uniref:Uncharacterized protein n=1 Tax=Marinicauda salina TaxID=2135793 RepID=A0A2U2BRV3_9PROT|nr:hypothetical protein [Marinicauda salina]PWE16743.1 hypothetical protein DDZ18_11100 [Marinicauda salina]
MTRLITLIAATASAAGLAATAVAQENELQPNVLQQLPAQVLDRVLDIEEETDETDADAAWPEGESSVVLNCVDPSLSDVGDQVWIMCNSGSPTPRGVDRAAVIWVKFFDYGALECAGDEGALADSAARDWPSDACIALWEQVDARKALFMETMLQAMRDGWRIGLSGRTLRDAGHAELRVYTVSPR